MNLQHNHKSPEQWAFEEEILGAECASLNEIRNKKIRSKEEDELSEWVQRIHNLLNEKS